MTEFVVALEVFEGPLDLLLTLVRRAELDITTVALARVTDAYLRYLTQIEEIDPGALASFCEVAASLILIKSQALLPRPPAPPEDELADAEALAERLREYRRFRETADRLAERQKSGLRAYARVARPPEVAPRLDPADVSVDLLASAFEDLMAEAASRELESPRVAGVRPYRYRLSDRLLEIRRTLVAARRVSFRELLLGPHADREYVIVSFLAVLELLRRTAIRAVQSELFGEIEIELLPGVAERWALEGLRDEPVEE